MCVQQAWPITVKWLEDFQLVEFDDQGHSLVMGVPPPNGSNAGFSPMRLLLISLAGCTAMDIALIVKKQRQTLTSLTVYVTGDQADEYPRYFKTSGFTTSYVVRI